MSELPDFLRVYAASHRDYMIGAETFARLLRGLDQGNCRVSRFNPPRWIFAHIARPAGLSHFAKIGHQDLAATRGRFAITEQRIQALMLPELMLRIRAVLTDELSSHPDIIEAVKQDGLCRLTVPPSPTNFLIIGLRRTRQIRVKDEANVGFINTHAESDCRAHHNAIFGQKAFLISKAVFGAHPRMIG